VTIVTRVWIPLVVVKRIPAIIVAKRDMERDECRSPPTSISVVPTAWTPRPSIVVIDPPSEVIRRPTPGFVTNPRPTIRWAPRPMAVTIWNPIIVDAYGGTAWQPNPTKFSCVRPIAIGIQIFRPPKILVVILNVVPQPLCEIALAIIHPVVKEVPSCCCKEFPVACIIAFVNQLCRSSIAQSESRRIRIDARTATVTHCKAHASLLWHIDAIGSNLFRG